MKTCRGAIPPWRDRQTVGVVVPQMGNRTLLMRQSLLIGRQIILMLHNGGRNDQGETAFRSCLEPLKFSVDASSRPPNAMRAQSGGFLTARAD